MFKKEPSWYAFRALLTLLEKVRIALRKKPMKAQAIIHNYWPSLSSVSILKTDDIVLA